MGKTIQEQISEMETRLKKLEKLQALFEKMVELEFGIKSSLIHQMIEKNEKKDPRF